MLHHLYYRYSTVTISLSMYYMYVLSKHHHLDSPKTIKSLNLLKISINRGINIRINGHFV